MDRAWDTGIGLLPATLERRRYDGVETLERLVAARAGGRAAAQNSTLTCHVTVTSRAEVTDKSPTTPTLTVPWASLSFSLYLDAPNETRTNV